MSLSSLAKTIFSTGPDDALATIDVYKKRTSSVVNSIQAIADRTESELGALSLIKIATEKVPIVDYLIGEKQSTREEILARFSADDSGLKSGFRDLSDKVKSSLGVAKSIASSVKAVINGETGKLIKRGIQDARTISGLVDKFTKGNYKVNFKDIGSVSGLITSLSYEASRLGLPNTFSTIAKTISDKSILLVSAKDLFTKAVKDKDINLLLDMSGTQIGKDLKSLNPNGIKSMISGFKLPTGSQGNSLSSYYDKVSTGFDRIDSSWKSYSRNGNQAMSASQIAASDDFKMLLEAKAMSRPLGIPRSVGGVAPTLPVKSDDESFLMLLKKFDLTTVKKELTTLLPTTKIKVNPTIKDYECVDNEYFEFNKWKETNDSGVFIR